MARAKNGQAISKPRRTLAAVAKLRKFAKMCQRSDPDAWRRAVVVLAYINGKRVAELAETFQVGRSTINEWLRGYEAVGVDGLVTRKPPGAAPRLTEVQRQELVDLIESGPMAAGFTSGVWTGPIIGQLIRKRFGVNYHNHHVPRLLHSLGFSVQRPRKRLARADLALQEYWLRERFPSIKKKREPAVV
jgi:transposase